MNYFYCLVPPQVVFKVSDGLVTRVKTSAHTRWYQRRTFLPFQILSEIVKFE